MAFRVIRTATGELEWHGARGRRPARARQRRLRGPVHAARARRGRPAGDEPRGADRRRPRGLLHDVAREPAERGGPPAGRSADDRARRRSSRLETGFTITRIELDTVGSRRRASTTRRSSASPSRRRRPARCRARSPARRSRSTRAARRQPARGVVKHGTVAGDRRSRSTARERSGVLLGMMSGGFDERARGGGAARAVTGARARRARRARAARRQRLRSRCARCSTRASAARRSRCACCAAVRGRSFERETGDAEELLFVLERPRRADRRRRRITTLEPETGVLLRAGIALRARQRRAGDDLVIVSVCAARAARAPARSRGDRALAARRRGRRSPRPASAHVPDRLRPRQRVRHGDAVRRLHPGRRRAARTTTSTKR